MLERQSRSGVALAGLLIGLPTAPALATVMEFGEEGVTRVRPSLNYLQRAKLLARDGAARAGMGITDTVDTGWTDPDDDPEPPAAQGKSAIATHPDPRRRPWCQRRIVGQ